MYTHAGLKNVSGGCWREAPVWLCGGTGGIGRTAGVWIQSFMPNMVVSIFPSAFVLPCCVARARFQSNAPILQQDDRGDRVLRPLRRGTLASSLWEFSSPLPRPHDFRQSWCWKSKEKRNNEKCARGMRTRYLQIHEGTSLFTRPPAWLHTSSATRMKRKRFAAVCVWLLSCIKCLKWVSAHVAEKENTAQQTSFEA